MDTSFHNWRPSNKDNFSDDSDSDVVENSITEKEKPRKIKESLADPNGSDLSPICVLRKKTNKPIIISDDESSDDNGALAFSQPKQGIALLPSAFQKEKYHPENKECRKATIVEKAKNDSYFVSNGSLKDNDSVSSNSSSESVELIASSFEDEKRTLNTTNYVGTVITDNPLKITNEAASSQLHNEKDEYVLSSDEEFGNNFKCSSVRDTIRFSIPNASSSPVHSKFKTSASSNLQEPKKSKALPPSALRNEKYNCSDRQTERDPVQQKSQFHTKTSGMPLNTPTPIVNELATGCDTAQLNNSLQNMKIKQSKFLPLSNDYTPRTDIEGNSKKPMTVTAIENHEIKESTDLGLQQRVLSLFAEKKRLQLEIVKVSKGVQTAKTTMKSVNLNSLPDRGVRLMMSLKDQERALKDLEEQQMRVAAQLHKHVESNILEMVSQKPLQQTVSGFGVRTENSVSQPPAWSKLPSSNVNEIEMGKRALETHRTQQALTLDALQRLHHSLKNCPNENTQLDDPEGLNIPLMAHQKHALAWLIWRESEIPSGGLLADDMGLGKTLTMIALILKTNEEAKMKEGNSDDEDDEEEDNKNKVPKGGTLVVCPATLLGQWEGEIRSRVKRGLLDIEIHHGGTREKKPARLARRDVVITTYSIVMRDCGGGKSGTGEKGPLMGLRWDRVILDEAHNIRNFKSQTSVAVCRLKARKRWALTGTPIQNKELDLFAQLKFLRCSPFDDIVVWRRWVDNKDAAGLQRLNTLTKSLMLRRTKEGLQNRGELTSLKDKHVQLISVHLNEHEMEVYERVAEFSQSLFAQFIYQKAEKEQLLNHGMPASKASAYLRTLENPFDNHPELNRLHRNMKAMNWDIKSHDILVLLLRLRQLCCHPSLISSMLDKEAALQDGIEDADGLDMDLMERMNSMTLEGKDGGESEGASEQVKQILTADNPVFKADRISSKMTAILTVMEENILRTEDKAVVVSQWTSMLNLLYEVFKTRGVKCELLTGSVPVKNRMAIVDRFNRASSGLKVLLLSLTAGGTGLNLVGGNHLMLIDLHWNPQLEAQASDRIYRVGQTKPVKIYKFVCMDTIEERIKKLQEYKLSLAEDVLTGSRNAQATKLSLDDLKMLFNVM